MAVADDLVAMTVGRVAWGDAQKLPAPGAPSVVTVGTFDGVHCGHRLLIAQAVAEARDLGVQAVAVTWDRHPKSVVAGAEAPPLVSSLERKIELLADSGLDLVLVLRLDGAMARWSPERFVREVFVQTLRARSIVVGSDWRFGHQAAGDLRLLEALGATQGFRVTAIDRETRAAEPASSTGVRRALVEGDLAAAAVFLGRPPELEGQCQREESSVTVLEIARGLACPPAGRYCARMRIADYWTDCDVEVRSNRRILIEMAGGTTSPAWGAAVRLQLSHQGFSLAID